MFGKIKCMFTKSKKVDKLEELIDYANDQLLVTKLDSKEYGVILGHIERLSKLKAQKRSWKVSPDVLAQVAGSLGGIVMILGFEKANILTSKAVGFVLRGRV